MKHINVFRYRLLFVLSAFVITVLFLNVANAYADEVERFDASVNGDNSVVVVISDSGEGQYKATIEGSGAMKDYGSRGEVPWLQDTNYRKKIVSVTVSSGVTHVGSRAFMDTKGNSFVSAITLPDGLQSIGTLAFQYNLAESVDIPKSVTLVESGAFTVDQDRSNLTVTMLGNNTIVEQKSNLNGPGKTVIAYEDSKTAESWQEVIGGKQNKTSLNTIPSYNYEDEKKTVTKYLAPGTDIILPDSVQTIEEGTFVNCNDLVSVHLNNVRTVKANAFQYCVNLKKVIIPSTLETIDSSAFADCDQVVIYGNGGTVAQSFAEENHFDFEILKPYMKSADTSFEKELPVGKNDTIDLSDIFAVDYESVLKYQIKTAESDYADIDGSSYEFKADEAGEFTLVFRAVDSFGEPSTDVYTAKYSVVNNTAPQLKQDEIQITALFYERPEINMSDVFTDSEGDTLTYRYVDANAIPEGRDINWDYIWNGGDANTFDLYDGKFVVYQSWTQYPRTIGKEQQFYVRAYDKWDVPSENYLKIKITVHSVNIIVNKGDGVHSLDGITFKFTREGAEHITDPSYFDDNNYYFDLDYVINETGSYGGGYDYTYEVALDGCEPVIGSYTTKNDNGETTNGPHTIEVTLSNPKQAAKDKQAVANVIDLIDNIGDITLDSEEAVNEAQAAYEALYDDIKPQVTNYEELHLSKLVLSSLKAQKAAEEAQAAAEEAERKAKEEQEKAEAAQQKAKEAQSKAETAQEAAETAKGEAEAAKQAAETAKGEAEAAKQAAETAKGEAETAKAEAETAKQAAETAKAEAEAAQQKAEKAAQEASSSDSETAKQIKELQDTLEKTAAELAALKDTLAAKENKVTGLKLKSKARKITATWKKNADADGYQVQFKLKSAKKYKTLKTLTGIKAVSKKLKKGKKYQFRVATYKTVDGKKIYGKWVTKTVKCK